MEFLCYQKCTTCKKAQKWLDENNIQYTFRDIKENNPSYEELAKWYKISFNKTKITVNAKSYDAGSFSSASKFGKI